MSQIKYEAADPGEVFYGVLLYEHDNARPLLMGSFADVQEAYHLADQLRGDGAENVEVRPMTCS